MFVIKILNDAFFGVTSESGKYISAYDPATPNDGFGKLELTSKITEAKKFQGFGEALNFWKQQSTTKPLRYDGKPNKPLSKYTVDIFDADAKARAAEFLEKFQ